MEALLREVEARLADRTAGEADLLAVLDRVLAAFSCSVGTIHRLRPGAALLELSAQRGLPEAILPRVRAIPIGKGMAGLAAERREPVQVCNLQNDDSGVAKPAARDTRMEGSISLPMIGAGELRGTLGVAKPTVYEFTPEEIRLLLAVAAVIGEAFARERAS